MTPPLDSTFHRDKDLTTTTTTTTETYDLKPESETPQESSTKKKDASQQEVPIEDDDTKNHAVDSNVDKDRVETNDSTTQSGTKKPEPEESTKKIHKHHPLSKENKINGEETLILGVVPTRQSDSSKTTASSNDQAKITKSTRSEEKPSATSKGEKSTERVGSVVSKTATKTFSTSTLNIETSSSVQVIESTPTRIVLRPTAVDSNADIKSSVVNLEPSRMSDIEYTTSISGVSTPTDGLPTSYFKSTATLEKNVVHPTNSGSFTKNTGTRILTGILTSYTIESKLFESLIYKSQMK